MPMEQEKNQNVRPPGVWNGIPVRRPTGLTLIMMNSLMLHGPIYATSHRNISGQLECPGHGHPGRSGKCQSALIQNPVFVDVLALTFVDRRRRFFRSSICQSLPSTSTTTTPKRDFKSNQARFGSLWESNGVVQRG